MKPESIHLIQPRHNYAPGYTEEPHGHIYLPTSLLTVMAKMQKAGFKPNFTDLNLHPLQLGSGEETFGINMLGAPYVPVVRDIQNEIRQRVDGATFILGGQIMSDKMIKDPDTRKWIQPGFSEDQRLALFGEDAVNGNNIADLTNHLGIEASALPNDLGLSLIPAYEEISDSDMREYLSREFSMFVSRGCNKQCDFCAAEKSQKETYRDLDIFGNDLRYLINRAKKLGITGFEIYMSNLDVIQSPNEVRKFAKCIKEIKSEFPDFKVGLRGLATVDNFIDVHKKDPEAISELAEAGFHTIGFGVDGFDDELFKALHKGNTMQDSVEAVKIAREVYGLTPETLMVFGHSLDEGEKRDTPESLDAAYKVTKLLAERYGAIPRPHVSKPFIPRSQGWINPRNKSAVERLIRDPDLFQGLDFCALPTELTHPDENLRSLTEEYFLKICQIVGNTTQPIIPIRPGMSDADKNKVRRANLGKYDR